MTSPILQPQRLGYVPALDGMRAVAVLVVMAFHAQVPGFLGGRAGVDVFFVLSGFLITCLLLQEQEANGNIRLGAFYMRRALRLYPALVATILLALALTLIRIPIFGASNAAFHDTLIGTPFALFYTMNIPRATGWASGGYLGHTWSLAIEEQFYLVWPLVVILLFRRRANPSIIGWVALVCAVTSAALRTGLDLSGVRGELLYNATFSHVDGIFAGCAMAVVWMKRRDLIERLTHPLLTLMAMAAMGLVFFHGQNMNIYGYAVVVVTTMIVLGDALTRPDGWLARLLSTAPFVAIGRRSYGLYLYHWPIFLFIGIDPRLPILALGFGLSFAAAWISFVVIERPFLARKGRWSSDHITVAEVGQQAERQT